MINIDINNYDYNLDEERIAKFPLEKRDESKLLFFKNGDIKHYTFKEIPNLIDNSFIIVKNSTKVIYSRIFTKKISGGKVEILCVEPVLPSSDPQLALNSKNYSVWNCIIGGKRLNIGDKLLLLNDSEVGFTATILKKEKGDAQIEFKWEAKITFSELIEKIGQIPIPPYLNREPSSQDYSTYQTVYAQNEGSVASPTAGLHFTNEILNRLTSFGVNQYNILLHIGPGTFLPVKTDNVYYHSMHSEKISFSLNTLELILKELQSKKKIISIGTTSIRALESLYWYGYKITKQNNPVFNIEQWYPYNFNIHNDLTFEQSIESILNFHKNDNHISGITSLIIVPGYKFKSTDVLITNFHQPKSTLLLLISAFIGDENRKKIYNEAINNNYRFLSYGDSSILFK